MNLPRPFPLLLVALALGSAINAAGAVSKRPPPKSDLASIESRKVAVNLAASLAKVDTPESLAGAGLNQPFNPTGFVHEVHATTEVVATVKPVSGDREILTALASRVVPKGTLGLGSNLLLSFGKKNLRPGDHIAVNFEGQDYNLELVGFDRTNFTLRLNHEEITRPINNPGKNP